MELFGYQKSEIFGLKPATNAICVIDCAPCASGTYSTYELYVYL